MELIESKVEMQQPLEKDGQDILKKVSPLIEDMPSKIASVKGKNIVLVVGLTGAGKSTTTNYMLGCKIKRGRAFFPGVYTAVPIPEKNENFAPVQDRSISHTLYPEGYLSKEGFVYCDCPGFLDNRELEKKICTSIGMESAIKAANAVSAVMVVIDYFTLITTRAEGIRSLSNILGILLKNPTKKTHPLLFVFTKTGGNPKEAIIDNIENIISDIKNEQQNNPTGHALEILQLIREDTDRVACVDVFDDGKSRKEIIDILRKLTPCSKTEFNFNECDEHRAQFDKTVYEKVNEVFKILHEIIHLPEVINSNKQTLEETKRKYNFYEKEISILKDSEKEKKGFMESLLGSEKEKKGFMESLLNKITKANTPTIESLEKAAKKLDEEQAKINDQLRKIDNSDPILYWVKRIRKKINFFEKRVFESQETHIFDYQAKVPYIEVKEHTSNGTFKHIDDSPDKGKGIYKTSHTSGKGQDIDASVHIFIETRYRPDNYAYIEHLFGLREIYQNQKLEFEKAAMSLREEIKTIQLSIESLNQKKWGNPDNIKKQQVKSLESTQGKNVHSIKKLEEMIKNNEECLKKNNLNFEQKRLLVDTLKKIISIIDYDSELIRHFSEYLKIWENKKDIQIQSLHGTQNWSFENDNLKIDSFYCALSRGLMNDPVMLPCGHSFERYNITLHCNSKSESNLLPTCPAPSCEEPINKNEFRSNINLKNSIEQWKKIMETYAFSKKQVPENYNVEGSSKFHVVNSKNKLNRKGLSSLSNENLIILLNLPENCQVGQAIDDGGCFFDAIAQVVNELEKTTRHTEKSVREECHRFYLNNKEKVDQWNKEDGGIKQGKEYFMIQYTRPELEKCFNGKSPIWGRGNVEGRILCNQLKLTAIHLIELTINPENNQPIPTHFLITTEKMIQVENNDVPAYTANIPVLVVSQADLHFVPILLKKENLTLENYSPEIQKSSIEQSKSTIIYSPLFRTNKKISPQRQTQTDCINHENDMFLSHPVLKDKDGGYEELFKITREEASVLLLKNISKIQELLEPTIKEELLKENFIHYLIQHRFVDANLYDLYEHHKDCEMQTTLQPYATDHSIINGYINYDVRDKKVDNGWSNPGVLQALAYLRRIPLLIWVKNEKNQLILHESSFHDSQENIQNYKHLLFSNGNHFEYLEWPSQTSQLKIK